MHFKPLIRVQVPRTDFLSIKRVKHLWGKKECVEMNSAGYRSDSELLLFGQDGLWSSGLQTTGPADGAEDGGDVCFQSNHPWLDPDGHVWAGRCQNQGSESLTVCAQPACQSWKVCFKVMVAESCSDEDIKASRTFKGAVSLWLKMIFCCIKPPSLFLVSVSGRPLVLFLSGQEPCSHVSAVEWFIQQVL